MPELVWVADWEMQCCGEPFDVGGQVTWRLSRCEPDLLLSILGPGGAAPNLYYDHHSAEPSPPPMEQRGTVRSIQSVWCAYRQRGQVLTPVSGSAELRRVDRATGWEDEHADGDLDHDGLRFVGYLVELDLRNRQPTASSASVSVKAPS